MNPNCKKVVLYILSAIFICIYPAHTATYIQEVPQHDQEDISNREDVTNLINNMLGKYMPNYSTPAGNSRAPKKSQDLNCAPPSGKIDVFTFSGYGDKKQIEEILSNIYQINAVHRTLPDGSAEMSNCSSFRLHKNWLITAAHCLGDIYPDKVPVNGAINVTPVLKGDIQKVKGENDYAIIISAVSEKRPANGYAYIYNGKWPGQGPFVNTTWYNIDSSIKVGPWWTYTPQKPNVDVALIKINDTSPAGNTAVNIYQIPNFKNMPKNIQKAFISVHAGKAENDRDCFMAMPVKDYEFLIIPEAEHSHALYISPVLAFFFKGHKIYDIFENRYQDYSLDYGGVRFNGDGIVPGTSGSPIVQGKMIVGVVSTAMPDKGLVASPFYNERIRSFIEDSMGADASGIKFVKPIPVPK